MTRHTLGLLVLASLALTAGPAPGADCAQGKALHDASWAEPNPERRIELLRQSTAACPDPSTFMDLATAYLGVGDRDAAISALESAAQQPGAEAQQGQIQTRLARLYLEQGRLGEASASVGLALHLAGDPAPADLLALRRAIDTDPGRSRLSAEQITRGLTPRGILPRGFEPRARLDLYVLFDFNQAEPNAAGQAQVLELAKALAGGGPGQRYRLIGHTDTQGPADYNQGLSERRTAAVRRQVLVGYPDLAGRLDSLGCGETQPKVPGDTEEAHRLNRRVELLVLP